MNYYVPDFDMEDDHHLISNSSNITRHKAEDEIMELFWQDGQVIAQPQNQRKSPQITAPPLAPPQPPQPQQQQQLYMAEDEMATWLHYPLEDLYSELLCENPTSPLPPPELRPSRPAPPLQTPATTSNFQLFSRMRGGNNLERSSSLRPGSTVVESNTTPALATMRSVGEVSSALPITHGGERLQKGGSSGEVTVSSSSGYSGGPANTRTVNTEEGGGEGVINEAEKRKKKRKESTPPPSTTAGQDLEQHEADDDEKKHSGGHSTKRSRAAEVHNLSERRRRDRINERMKALQELIPRCNKSDKASMLDEAIEYLKSLQMQVQMMSMGCGMVPMMYPGMQQQYMAPMGMGMGMGMDMGMTRPVMPFPSNVPGSNMPAVPAGAQFGPRYTLPPVNVASVPTPSFPGNQTNNQGVDVRGGTFPIQRPAMAQLPNMTDPYHQYMAAHQMQMMQMQMQQMQAVQNQSISQPGSSKPSTSKSEPKTGPSTSKSEAKDDQ